MTMRGVQVTRRGKTLIGPVDLDLEGRGVTVVLGPNGSGKTTLLNVLHGMARLKTGRVTWTCGPEDARRHQAFVFQRPVMLRRSVLANIAYPLRLRGFSSAKADTAAKSWADKVGLADLMDQPAHVLSGGEQQKLALARALITEPKLLFLDEPCASLDGRSTREIEQILTHAQEAGTRLILSTHDLGQARRLADEILFMLHGKLHEHSSAAQFFDAANTAEARAFLRGDIVE
jgi:tungstate transport system ATP-binding protein